MLPLNVLEKEVFDLRLKLKYGKGLKEISSYDLANCTCEKHAEAVKKWLEQDIAENKVSSDVKFKPLKAGDHYDVCPRGRVKRWVGVDDQPVVSKSEYKTVERRYRIKVEYDENGNEINAG